MYVFNVTDPNEGLAEVLRALQSEGLHSASRNGPVVRFPRPVCLHYPDPLQRMLSSAVRDVNPVFHLFETMWMFAGMQELKPLLLYNAGMAQYSDDGENLRGTAYGHRWRGYAQWGDQLSKAITELKADPDSRRVVVSMWDPQELGKVTKDQACLAGDTPLWSPEGDLPIAEVAAMFSRGAITRWPVYAVDEVTKDIRISWCDRVWKVGKKKVARISFDDGSSIRMTADHRLFRRANRRTRAQEAVATRADQLMVGDSVIATRRWVHNSGHERIKMNVGGNTAYANMQFTHRAYAELLFGPLGELVVHHVNENPEDNRACNLQRATADWHNAHHRVINNPMHNLTPEQHAARAEKQASSVRETWADRSAEERYAAMGYLPTEPNHLITDIEWLEEEEDVYDFHVPEKHAALIGTGVVSHNCNLQAVFNTRPPTDPGDGRHTLDMTVTNRSNDLIYGAMGSNMYHFSMLLEYVALHCGFNVGSYYQVSANLHLYTENPTAKRCWDNVDQLKADYISQSRDDSLTRLGLTHDKSVIRRYIVNRDDCPDQSYLRQVLLPLVEAYHVFKIKARTGASVPLAERVGAACALAGACASPQLAQASTAWFQRRLSNASGASHV